MKRVLVIVFSDVQHDARVARQIAFLKNEYELTVLAYGGNENDGYRLLTFPKPKLTLLKKVLSALLLLLRSHETAFRILFPFTQAKQKIGGQKFDLIIANDVETLPWAFEICNGAPVLWDAHEYAPRHFEDRLSWRIFFQGFNIHLCKKYIPRVAAMTTVGKGLANEYEKNFGIKPTVITNANWKYDLQPSPVGEKIKMIHHGGSTPSRKLELMIEMMRFLDDRFELGLMLIVPPSSSKKTRGYTDYLKSLAGNDPRIRFLAPMKSSELVPFLHQYDIGVFLLPPVNFNYANTLPNKLFDFIQARLAIAIGPTPEMAEIVNQYKIGVVSEDFTPEALAKKLSQLSTTDLAQMKLNASKASEELNADKNQSALLSLVKGIIGS